MSLHRWPAKEAQSSLFCVSPGVPNAGGWGRECLICNQSHCLQLCCLSASLHMPMPFSFDSTVWYWSTLHLCGFLELALSCYYLRHARKETHLILIQFLLRWSHSSCLGLWWYSSFSWTAFQGTNTQWGWGVVLGSGDVRSPYNIPGSIAFNGTQGFCRVWFILLDFFNTASDFLQAGFQHLTLQVVRLLCVYLVPELRIRFKFFSFGQIRWPLVNCPKLSKTSKEACCERKTGSLPKSAVSKLCTEAP